MTSWFQYRPTKVTKDSIQRTVGEVCAEVIKDSYQRDDEEVPTEVFRHDDSEQVMSAAISANTNPELGANFGGTNGSELLEGIKQTMSLVRLAGQRVAMHVVPTPQMSFGGMSPLHEPRGGSSGQK